MTAGAHIAVQRAAGAVLRSVKRHGVSEQRMGPAARGEPLRPAIAIEALLAAMRARFALPDAAVHELLRPALADWRDAVGCADPVLVAANAQGATPEKHLVPLPMPSWCTALVECGVLRLEGPPVLEGPRVVQPAWLAVIREVELTAVELFPFTLAGRYGSGAASLHIHLAVSPGYLDAEWRAPVLVRAGAQRLDKSRAPVGLWIGAPATPEAPAAGHAGECSVTWAARAPPAHGAPDWPAGWPRWVVLRALEGREPQALWELPALWRGAMGTTPEGAVARASSANLSSMRLSVDIGSTSTVVAEEDNAAAGAVGVNLLPRGVRRSVPSGFRRLAGDPATAHRVGCADHLLAPGGQLPTALCAPGRAAADDLLHGSEGAIDQLWLPQGAPDGSSLLLDRFKSPELLLLSEWLAQLGEADPAAVSRQLLETYAHHLGRTLAVAHATPLVTPEGGQWTRRRPRLSSCEAVVTYPPCAFDAAAQVPFREVFDGVGARLCEALRTAWTAATHRLIADPIAAAAVRGKAHDERHPVEVLADFGGLTLQVTVRTPHAPGRAEPFIAGSSMSYLLGGERLIDAAAFAAADRDAPETLRESYRDAARRWRTMIAAGEGLRDGEAARHAAVGDALLGLVLSLVRRQVQGTLRRCGPSGEALRGAGISLHLLGEGWKLVALDAADDLREAETLRRIEEHLAREPLAPMPLQLHRMTKRRVCEGALRVHGDADAATPPLELQGVDVASGDTLRQRWFGIAGAATDPELLPDASDGWFRAFSGEAESLLRMEQWFCGAPASPFQTRLAGGNLAFDPRRSVLKQWVDVSGPSLAALRIRDALAGQ